MLEDTTVQTNKQTNKILVSLKLFNQSSENVLHLDYRLREVEKGLYYM